MIKKAINKLSDLFEEWILDNPLLGVIIIVPTFLVVMIGSIILIDYSLGIKGFGPESIQQVTIQRLYVDGGKSSHYMVGTDQGVLEVDNILWPVQVFNSDELYSQLEVGKTYTVKIKGNKVINWFVQEYPYIIEIQK